MKRLIGLGMALMLVGALAGVTMAVSSDVFTLLVQPGGDYGVLIDTDSVNLGGLTAGNSAQTGAIPVETDGTLGPVEYTILAAVTVGSATLDDNDTLASTEIGLKAEFVLSSPSFDAGTKDIVTTAAQQVGDAAGKYEGAGEEMDDMAADGESHNLFCQVTLPSPCDYSEAHTLTVTINAQAAD